MIVCIFFSVNAYARNGMGVDAIALYRQMPEKMRNAVSHICVLNACSHSGLVDEARAIFNDIDVKSEKIISTMVSLSLLKSFLLTETILLYWFRSIV
jgi:pentatricopeptide repeat protein